MSLIKGQTQTSTNLRLMDSNVDESREYDGPLRMVQKAFFNKRTPPCFGCEKPIIDYGVCLFGTDMNGSNVDFFCHIDCAEDIMKALSEFIPAAKEYVKSKI